MAGPMKIRTANYVAASLKEMVRLYHRDDIQHCSRSNLVRAAEFIETPVSLLSAEIRQLSTAGGNLPVMIRTKYENEWSLKGLSEPITSFEETSPDDILRDAVTNRTSDIPSRMLTVIGSERRPSANDALRLFSLGKELARHRMVVLTDSSGGYLQPFLQGFSGNGGLSIGMLDESQVDLEKDMIREKSGLVSFPIVGFNPQENDRRRISALMSGRLALLLGSGRHEAKIYEALAHNAYFCIPAVTVNVPETKQGLPDTEAGLPALEHVLQYRVEIEDVVPKLLDFIPSDIDNEEPENYDYLLKGPDKMPVSVFSGCAYSEGHASKELGEEMARNLAEHGFLTITGSGPGAMADFARAASEKSLTVGINKYPTFISSNPWIDIPVLSNLQWERISDLVLSGMAMLNLGGSFETGYEMIRARELGKPILSCAQCENMEFFAKIQSKRGFAPIASVSDAVMAMELLMRLRYVGSF